MFAFGNRQANRRKHHKSAEGRRRDQEVRAAYKTQLRFEPLEDRRLLSVLAVTNLLDGSVAQAGDLPGSLRQAIFDANANPGADTISFDPSLSGGTIALTSGELAITDSVTIQGLGAANLTIDAGGISRIFDARDNNDAINSNVEIDGLTLTGGSGTSGGPEPWATANRGGAIFSCENLTVRDSMITGNTAGSTGGGIYSMSTGATVIENSTISGNTSGALGGGIGAWTKSAGTTTIQNCTISGNTATGWGGGIDVWSDNNQSTTTIQNSTISGNTAGPAGGGIYPAGGGIYSNSTALRSSRIARSTEIRPAVGVESLLTQNPWRQRPSRTA